MIPVGANVVPMPLAPIPAWQRPGFIGSIRRFAEPRLLMTAAMAFFSIALTLNLTGVRLSNVRFADLRPIAVRSFMERRLTTASVPIIRYYDHLRFVYEVESKMRQLHRTTEGEGVDTAPGESKQIPAPKDGGSHMNPPPQQSGSPAYHPSLKERSDFLETSLTFHGTSRAFRRLQNRTTETAVWERSTTWTA
jgi:hypothetical protein